jgi:serine/threonine protein kinase
MVAMKLIDKQQLTRQERDFLRDEIQIIRSICHPNVVEMRDAFETHQHMYIMMEVIQGGELFEHIKDCEISGNTVIVDLYLRKGSMPGDTLST